MNEEIIELNHSKLNKKRFKEMAAFVYLQIITTKLNKEIIRVFSSLKINFVLFTHTLK